MRGTGWGVTGGSGTHLLILQLHSDDSEGAAGSVVVDVDPAETLLAGFDGYPFLTGVIVDHHGSPGLADTLFTAEQEKTSVSGAATRDGSWLCPFLSQRPPAIAAEKPPNCQSSPLSVEGCSRGWRVIFQRPWGWRGVCCANTQ